MIYLDHNATTRVAPEVLEAMLPFFRENWGNPSSSYRFGSKLKSVIEKAREQVANLIGAHPMEILFTSCATESNNTAIHAALSAAPEKRHVVTSSVEHSSVLNHCKALEATGYRVTYLPVDRNGLLKLDDLEVALTPDTAVVSLMWANNETGVLFPVDDIAALCRSKGIPYHCDAVQSIGRLNIDLKKLPIDYLSMTGHKINAAKGIGALYINRKAPFKSFLYGGHQEKDRRGGTENVPLIVGLGVASTIAAKNVSKFSILTKPLRDNLENGILDKIPSAKLNGSVNQRLSNTTNISFAGVQAEALLLLLDQNGICASSGSACLADSPEPSHVVFAMTNSSEMARSAIRFSLSHMTTAEEIDHACLLTVRSVNTLTQ